MSLQVVDGHLKHLLTTEQLGSELISRILDTAASFIDPQTGAVGKFPALRGKTVVNLFFEPSTRTRTTFELAAKRLSADVLNLNIATSATTKGESLLDTLRNLEAMQADLFVVRHNSSGAAHFFAEHAAPHVSVVNAGDGRHAHPTQALLDCYTIRDRKGSFKNLEVAIIGDLRYSRVARSQIHALNALGAKVRVAGPRTLMPTGIEALGVTPHASIESAVDGADVIIMLRLQRERMSAALLPSASEYFGCWGLNTERLALANPDAIVMHPGPINRGVEISSAVADGPQSVILDQVTCGIAIRMAVMSLCLAGGAA